VSSRAILLDWLVGRIWIRDVLIERAKSVSPRETDWPTAATHPHKEVFFGRLIDILQTEVERDVAIEVLEAWAKAYPADSKTLLELVTSLHQQTTRGADLEGIAGVLPSSVSKAPAPRLAATNSPGLIATPITQTTIRHPVAVFSGKADRGSMIPRFLNFARNRDLLFALGGVGSGLDTFTRQVIEHCQEDGLIVVDADLIPDYFRQIESARRVANALAGANVHLELKCLLTALAYATYNSLRSQFQEYIDRGFEGRYYAGPIRFSDYYFASCKDDAMFGADSALILKHFFETVQRFAEMTKVEEILVVMPWRKLAACFRANAQPEDRKLGNVLWQAMGHLATRSPRRPRNSYARPPQPPPPLDMYDKVCLVACCSEVPYAHNAQQQKALVARCICPSPPWRVRRLRTSSRRRYPRLKLMRQRPRSSIGQEALRGLSGCL